eukprot:679923-Rhodomonas_salina.1
MHAVTLRACAASPRHAPSTAPPPLPSYAPSGIVLRARYAMSGTELARAMLLRACYAISVTGLAYAVLT